MEKIWANRLIANTKSWEDVPDNRKVAVKAELEARVAADTLSQEKYCEILGIEMTVEGDDTEEGGEA